MGPDLKNSPVVKNLPIHPAPTYYLLEYRYNVLSTVFIVREGNTNDYTKSYSA